MDQQTIEKAIAQDQGSQEEIIHEIGDLVFNLSLRMLGDVEDAKDASQEILLHVLKKLHTFRFESAFTTWVYRLSMNDLLRTRQKRSRYEEISFEIYAMDLIPDRFDISYESDTDPQLLAQELKYSCSNVMLQCLDARSRSVYVLGTMFQIDAKRGAEILSITPENYRQILSRTKRKMTAFLDDYCMNKGHCDCMRRLGHAIRTNRLQPSNLQYSSLKQLDKKQILQHTQQMEEFETQSDFFAELPQEQAEQVLAQVVSHCNNKCEGVLS